MAPAHVLGGVDDPWFPIDTDATFRLRNYLDRSGAGHIPIIYSLAVSNAMFRANDQRRRIIDVLRTLPITELWLKVDGFGAAASPTAARTYIAAAAEFHELGIPIVADQVGGVVGLSLLAFGAVGGIAHGITLGERFDASPWRRPAPENSPSFGLHRRVYVPAIDAMLKPKEAQALIEISARTRSLFACNDSRCCPRARDMIEKPGRHFLSQRIKEVTGLSQIPERLRPQRFLDQHLRAATDKALTAATINWGDEPMAAAMAKKMQDNRKRLDNLRIALGNHAEATPPESFAQLPKTRATREDGDRFDHLKQKEGQVIAK